MRARLVAFLFLCTVLIPRGPADSLAIKNGFVENFLKWVKKQSDCLAVNQSQNCISEISAAEPALGQIGTEDPARATAIMPFGGGGAPAKGLPLKPRLSPTIFAQPFPYPSPS